MTQRSSTTVVVMLKLPVPPGKKPKTLVDEIREMLKRDPVFRGIEDKISLQVVKRETTYLMGELK